MTDDERTQRRNVLLNALVDIDQRIARYERRLNDARDEREQVRIELETLAYVRPVDMDDIRALFTWRNDE